MAKQSPTILQTQVGHLEIGAKIGKGSFGSIYHTTNIQTSEAYACKSEDIGIDHAQLAREARILRRLQSAIGIPELFYCGKTRGTNVIVMTLLGESLEVLFRYSKAFFTVKTVLMVADQCLQRLEFIHSRGIVHRDIKPDNFLIGRGPQAPVIHLIDFGLSGTYWDARGRHISEKNYGDNKNVKGTVRYISLNVHRGIEQSRRDDLESLGYVLVYLLRTSMPWSGILAKSKSQHFELIMEIKQATPLEDLCKGQPTEFATFLQYCRSLKFQENPKYDDLRNLFALAYRRSKFQADGMFGWTKVSRNSVSGSTVDRGKGKAKRSAVNQVVPLGFNPETTPPDTFRRTLPKGTTKGFGPHTRGPRFSTKVGRNVSPIKQRRSRLSCFCGNTGKGG